MDKFIIQIQKFNLNILSPIFVFFLSIVVCLAVLLIERSLGINWDFHPDSSHYIRESSNLTFLIFNNYIIPYTDIVCTSTYCNILSMKGKLFYIIVHFLNSNINLIVGLN